jgi:hypothetical protein
MATLQVYDIAGINLKVQPLQHKEGDLLRSVNVETFPVGAKRKRPGYVTYLGTMPNGSAVQGLFNWQRNNGTQFWNYAFAGGNVYYSTQGTGAWTIAGNGTWNPGGTVTNAVGWDNGTVGTTDVLFVADGIGTVRHSTDGTSFTDTAGAPSAVVSMANYKGRIYAGGTNSYVAYSNFATVTDWVNDSTNFLVADAGRPLSLFKAADRLIITKNSGKMFRYDGFNLTDLATDMGPTSNSAIGDIEDFRIYPNRKGFFGYGGGKPELLSNAVERQVSNDVGEGIVGTTFDSMPGVTHKYRYYATIGTVTDDLTDETISDAVAVYDVQNNDWWNYKYANKPTAYLSFKDVSGDEQLIFGASDAQCYQLAGTATSDNGSPIESVLEGVIHAGDPNLDKDWREITASFNPGAQAKIQVGFSDTFTKPTKDWLDLGDAKDGVVRRHFPQGSRSKLLFWRVYDSSRDSRYIFYGFSLDYDIVRNR